MTRIPEKKIAGEIVTFIDGEDMKNNIPLYLKLRR